MTMRSDLGLLLVRLLTGGMLLFAHGWRKLTHFWQLSDQFPDPLGIGSTNSLALAVFAEFFCSLAVMMGLLTRLSVILPFLTMLIAAFLVHGPDPWTTKELPLLYAFVFLLLFLVGPGRFSLDYFMRRSN